MATDRRSRAWWTKTVAAWRRSGLTAGDFAAREGLTERTLRWWSSTLSRGTRAQPAYPIEIALPIAKGEADVIEVSVEGVTLRLAASTDVARIAALVQALRERRS